MEASGLEVISRRDADFYDALKLLNKVLIIMYNGNHLSFRRL